MNEPREAALPEADARELSMPIGEAMPHHPESVLPAAQDLMLAARALGIGSAPARLHPDDYGQFRALFGVPDHIGLHWSRAVADAGCWVGSAGRGRGNAGLRPGAVTSAICP